MVDSVSSPNTAPINPLAAPIAEMTNARDQKLPGIATPLPGLTSSDVGGLPARRAPNAQEAGDALKEMLDIPAIQFSITLLLNLLMKLANKQRTALRQSRMADANIAEEMAHESADDIRDAARDQLIGGVVNAGMKFTAATVSFGGGIKSAGAGDPQTVMNQSMVYQSMGQGIGSMGDATNSAMQYEGGLDQAQRAEDEGTGQKAKSIEESDKSDADDESQLIQSILQTFQKQEESRHEAVRATA